ncbi:acyl carrier protein [Streptomyces ossamyceticus]|jgi:acyl carrier protein|uniref:Acyl carrier protein n=1 Tax=Streptomyces ossamyceticus TaxID=249581 RepID=A0ABV2UUK6_9ACTN|nr:acyl carrier protein [Streptomyces sp. JV178]MDG5804629.1 acyl carrier protein [Streptomyces ossamyceticus]PIM73653.1 acyl carrier protein [Streptomyces sp. JV178]
MSNATVLDDLALVIADLSQIDVSDIAPEKSFQEDLDIDSLELVELGVRVEEKFSVKIPDDVLGTLKTVGAMADFVAGQL